MWTATKIWVLCLVWNAYYTGGVNGDCFRSEFRCGDGQCLDIRKKCDGVEDCADGSDEGSALCDGGRVNMTVGEKLQLKVQYRWEFTSLSFDLCNATNCSTLSVSSFGPSGRLTYFGYVGCNHRGSFCGKMYNSGYSPENGMMPSGELIFGVQRRYDGLSVWMDGHPFDTIWIPTEQSYNQFNIRPNSWYSDMPVEFTNYDDEPTQCSNREFQCRDGNCISLTSKCNGADDCSDGEDEDPTACELTSIDLDESYTVVAKVSYKAAHGPIHFLFCNDTTGCTNLRMTGCAMQGGAWFGFRADSCNSQGAFCNGGGAGSWCPVEESLPSGLLTFEIKLTDKWSNYQGIEVKLRGASRYSKSDSIDLGLRKLKIRPGNWISNMAVKYSVIPLSTSAPPTMSTAIVSPTPTTPSALTTETSTPPTSTSAPTSTTPAAAAWPPVPAPADCWPGYQYLLIPVAGSCREYIVCLSGTSMRKACVAPLHFSYELQTCTLPTAGQC